MSTTELIVVVVSTVVTLGVVAWFVGARKFPERAAGHGEAPTVGANTRRAVTRDVAARPAGPDAESMDASRPGGATPPPPPPQDEEPRP